MADEPNGNLDTKLSLEIIELLKALNERDHIAIVMVTHEEDMAAYAQRAIWMVDGRVERDGLPTEVFNREGHSARSGKPSAWRSRPSFATLNAPSISLHQRHSNLRLYISC
ncbi:hypothetical protein [Roseovarius sp. ZX-A-9]|uniref:hypothetical protein n=1 Tax=Roseovarius sp. ZX-A-9 TaxID=3014783 RepID=UPI00232C8198|nr:hypothetical protein [Roseovarius sp. ZX-A-9]